MILKGILIILLMSFSLMNTHTRSCSNYVHQHRGRPNLDISILSPSEHFKIHYDTSGENEATDIYANEVAAFADQVRNIIVNNMGFLPELNDEDGVYDIYIQDLGAYNYGYHVPDIPDDLYNYTPSSYILIDNEYEENEYYTSGLSTMQLTLAHEFFHAIQLAYREKNAGVDDYFYEMMGTWIEDIIVPEGNDYIYWVDNDDMFDSSTLFFINPESSMTTSNGYSIALFAHYLNNVYSNGDGTIIRQIWEELDLIEGGCGITCGIDSIKNVLLNTYDINFEEVWSDFCSKIILNGTDSNYSSNFYFHNDQRYIISLLTHLPEPQGISAGETLFDISLDNVSSRYQLYQANSLGILSFDYEDVTSSDFIDYISIISESGPMLNQHLNDLSSVYVDEGDIIVFTSSSSIEDFNLNVKINYSTDLTLYQLEGDSNLDTEINIQDIINMIAFLLYDINFNPMQFENSDMNHDDLINIFDIILLIEFILD